jgi:aryl-alcohol dehydrogenase-like predicted oxidoreductase
VQLIAEQRGASMAQVALAWVTDRPAVTSTILGARTVEQLDDNLGAAELHLDDDEIATLNDVSDRSPSDYPYGPLGSEQRDRNLAGGR